MRTMHLFAGAGGGLYADLILGHTPIVAVECDPYACECLRMQRDRGWWPDLEVVQARIDERQLFGGACSAPGFDAAKYKGSVDCINAGFPCQDISCAGSGRGIEHGERSGLWREVVRCAAEAQPRYMFFENSPNIVTRGLDIVLKDLAGLGFDAEWCVLPASYVGAPHIRARWWCLCAHTDAIRQGRQRQQEHRGEQGTRGPVVDGLCEGRRGHGQDVDNADEKRRQRTQRKISTGRHSVVGTGANVADAMQAGQRTSGKPEGCTPDVAPGNANVADANKTGLPQREPPDPGRARTRNERPDFGGSDWWGTEPDVGRVAYGVANRRDRLAALGNGQVPLCAAVAWRHLASKLPSSAAPKASG